MLQTIVDYWVVWACGLIAGALVFIIKRIFKLEKEAIKKSFNDEEKRIKDEIIQTLEEEINTEVDKSNCADSKMRADMEVLENSMKNLTKGVLAIQGREFRSGCITLLQPGHVITMDEYEQCIDDHEAYHALGGNHRGDSLFASVEEKWKSQITQQN